MWVKSGQNGRTSPTSNARRPDAGEIRFPPAGPPGETLTIRPELTSTSRCRWEMFEPGVLNTILPQESPQTSHIYAEALNFG